MTDRDYTWKQRGWAIRPPFGKQYGVTYIELYRNEVKELFFRGMSESSNKLSAAMMRDELKRLHPGRYSIPGENEIRTEISKLFAATKRTPTDGQITTGRRGRRTALVEPYKSQLEALFHEQFSTASERSNGDLGAALKDGSLKPKAMLQAFKARYSSDQGQPSTSLPSDDVILRKISVLKSNIKLTNLC